MIEVPTEAADVDEMAVLNGKAAMKACGVDEGDGIARGSQSNSSERTYMMKIVSTTKSPETTYLKHTECRSRGWTVTVCERQRKELK